MGRIITFAAPKYHSTSRTASPETVLPEDVAPEDENISRPRYTRPSSPCSNHSSCSQLSIKVGQQASRSRTDRKTKSVTFSEAPPIICEIPYWDRSPLIPSPDELENAQDESEADTDDDLPHVSTMAITRRHSAATSLEQATKWARRLSV